MDCVESSLSVALLSLLWTVLYVRADLTIRVSEDKCDNVYDLQEHNKINLLFQNNERTLTMGSSCLITIKSAFENSQMCIRRNTKYYTSCGLLLDVYFGTKPSSPYDVGVYTCSGNKPRCTTHSQLYTQFRQRPVGTGYFNFTVDVTVYLQEFTTTEKPTYVYKSTKGTFNPLASLMIPIGIAVGVCACTCFVIICVLCCGKCCQNQSTTTANTENNEERHELNDRPTIVASAPELPGDFNQASQWTDNNRPYSYSEEPPVYDRALFHLITLQDIQLKTILINHQTYLPRSTREFDARNLPFYKRVSGLIVSPAAGGRLGRHHPVSCPIKKCLSNCHQIWS